MKINQLRNKEISLVKVVWNQTTQDVILDLKDKISEHYPELFKYV